MPRTHEGEFKLEVPLDASGVKGFKPDRAVKVIAYGQTGHASEQTVRLDEKGKGNAILTFSEPPGGLRVVVGPENASAEQLKGLQTIGVNVSARQWGNKKELTLTPVAISAYYWWWWLGWCREYKITGRVLCPNGSPVPGAQVCAYDVDWWWWWWSEELVGCATTDASGSFEIDFTRCCGWWPWWWWELREWQLEPTLVGRIATLLRQDPKFRTLPIPSPNPSLGVFQQVLAGSGPGAPPNLPAAAAVSGGQVASPSKLDPAALDGVRKQLLQLLPPATELEELRLWPWWPWWPWWDCDADIIFKVTQNCQGQNTVIVNETVWDARADIPTNLNVTLVANDQACCIPQCTNLPDCQPQGDCVVLSGLCGDNVNTIGGNLGAPAAPIGLLNPGTPSIYGDRPYSGTVAIEGEVGDTVDYYEFLVSTTGFGGPWSPLPTAAVGGFDREVFIGPSTFTPVPFPPNSISDGISFHNVIETKSHYEANHGPQIWVSYNGCFFDTLMGLVTQGVLANGTYYLQMRGWTRPGYSGDLTSPRILPVCESKNANGVVVTIDNQTTNTPGPTDFYGLPCGAGTVHLCTVQPETAILQVLILHNDGTTTPVGPCDNTCITNTDTLQIDFAAYDPDAYLAYYTLALNYGASLTVNLLGLGGTLTPSPIPPVWAPAAAQVGPDYGSALTEGAVSPSWAGGAIRLQVSAAAAFPETCCYQLQLYAFKRTIGCSSCNSDHSFWNQYNLSESSFTIQVGCPAGS
jgi:hypothetical protein